MKRKFSLRKESRIDYTATRECGASSEDLRDGAILRIADSLEIIAREKRDLISQYEHRIAGLRGYIKRMKK